MHCMAWNGKR